MLLIVNATTVPVALCKSNTKKLPVAKSTVAVVPDTDPVPIFSTTPALTIRFSVVKVWDKTTFPVASIAIESVSDAEPIVPASGIIQLPLRVVSPATVNPPATATAELAAVACGVIVNIDRKSRGKC